MHRSPTLLDLFCGAGGLSLGFHRAGFRSLAAFDSWAPAIETYADNFDTPVFHGMIEEDFELPRVDVIVGGPPCQGFSSAGLRRCGDRRNSLVSTFARLVVRDRPLAFLFENVEGFLTGEGGRFVFELLDPLISAGYRIHLRKVNAANFGVPQHRKRVIAIGGLGWDPPFPSPSHSAFGAPGAGLATGTLPRTPTLGEALEGLPTVSSECAAAMDHRAHTPGGAYQQRVSLLGEGQCMRDLPEELWHESYRRRARRRVMDGTPTERRGGAPAGLRRLRRDEPSKAITGGAISEFVHPTEDRPLTVRECARLQTFPDTFNFSGGRRDRIQLIGNAVPPLLAERLGRTLVSELPMEAPEQPRGELLSFVPTLSSGASPILRQVMSRVIRRFSSQVTMEQAQFAWL